MYPMMIILVCLEHRSVIVRLRAMFFMGHWMMLDHIEREKINLHSLLVMHHGHPVLEAYFYPYHPDSLHDIRSAAKSIVSILIGTAIDEGLIQGVHQPVLDFFPGRTFAHLDSRKQRITIQHLLRMASGLIWSDADVGNMMQSPDWLQFVLDGEMVAEPGTVFNYSTPNTYLLSAILQQAAGMSALDYARKKLFDPLGIGQVRWQTDPHGVNMGGMGLWMTTQDMARIGQMMLQGGQQIVSEKWVKKSTTPPDGDYAYLWWTDANAFHAAGYGGQMIYVLPKQDMVVVFTAGLHDASAVTRALLENFIIPVVGESENSEAFHELNRRIQAEAVPQPKPIPPLPNTARHISGQRFTLATNRLDWKAFQLDFQEVSLTFGADTVKLPVGLDGVMQVSPVEKLGMISDHDPIGLVGSWTDETTFELGLHIFNNPENWRIRLHFDGQTVHILIADRITGDQETVTGSVHPPQTL